MKMKRLKKALSLFLCMALCVAMALITTGCNDDAGNAEKAQTDSLTVLGEGAQTFSFGVTDKEGNETWFEIHTDQETVGGALVELGLIEGEEGPFGLYVKAVNGVTADYDKDKVYWAFYVNDSYAVSGVDLTEIKEGEVYSFRIEK